MKQTAKFIKDNYVVLSVDEYNKMCESLEGYRKSSRETSRRYLEKKKKGL